MKTKLLITLFFTSHIATAQFTVTNAVNATNVVTTHLIPASAGIVTNAVFTGTAGGMGTFTNGDFGMTDGAVLSTGLVSSIAAVPAMQNDNDHAVHGDVDLQTLGGAAPITDVAVLEFDVAPKADTLSFKVIFASEEYPEYVCANFSDVFGIFITGANPAGGNYIAQNMALVPGTSLPIGISSINSGTPGVNASGGTCSLPGQSLVYSSYYVTNNGTTIIFDAHTTTITVNIPVIICANYHIKFAISDVSDGIFDSGVFLEGNTSTAPGFHINASSSQSVSVNDSTYLCLNDTLTLSAPAGLHYSWASGETTQAIQVTTPAVYQAIITDSAACFALSYSHVVVIDSSCSVVPGPQSGKPMYEIVTHRAGTYLGTINIELFPTIAPQHVANFDSLVAINFLDSTAFHRVVPGFVIQGGDPNSINGPISTWGQGQPWQQTVPAEFSAVQHLRGRIGAARDVDTNSANSQFYICVANALSLDGQYTVYGQVTSGMDIADTIVSSPRDVNDVPLQKIEMFVSFIGYSDTIPAAPTLTSPGNGAVDILNGTTFHWSQVSDAVLYTLQVSDDTSFTNITAQRFAGTNSVTIQGLNPSASYYWRVKADNGGNESAWSGVNSFSTKGQVQLVYPANNDINIPINPTFTWTAMSNINSYNLQVDYDSNFVAPFFVNINGITQTQRQVNNLPPNTPLWWRVRYISGGLQGFFSEKFAFTTGTSVGLNEYDGASGQYIKNIYPVPAESEITIEFNDFPGGSLDFRTIAGQSVLSETISASSGETMRKINTKNIARGVYLITLKTEVTEESRIIELK